MAKIFYVININDRNLQTIIDGIRFLADPHEKHLAHITVRGPYEREYSVKTYNEIIKNKKIQIEGLSNFFAFKQNTVYLKCSSPYLIDIWYKKDYPSFNPHLTIYDGKDKGFAEKLYSLLDKYEFNFSIEVNEIRAIHSYKGQFNEVLGFEYDFSLLSYYLKEEISYQKILDMNEGERLERIRYLSEYFKNWSKPHVYPSPINQLIEKLEFKEENGLFYFSDLHSWKNKFPYRIIRALKEIKPYAFYSLLKSEDQKKQDNADHPRPFNQPIILFFDNPSEEDEKRIHEQVFSFGQAPVIFIDKINGLEVYNGLRFAKNKNTKKLFKIGDGGCVLDFSYKKLLNGNTWFQSKSFNNLKKVDEYLLDNLSQARSILIEKFSTNPSIANSLIGRLLFIRYLIDRGVEFKKAHGTNAPYFPGRNRKDRNEQFISIIPNSRKLYEFFEYLELKLNGDLFPISDEERNSIGNSQLEVLYYLFKGGKIYPDSTIQDSLFDIYDFKIIPIELISNIYEQFIGTGKRFQNKSFYTPSFLVDYILSQTVTPHLKNTPNISCKVLDPSCGSGIFLIETLRKIIEKYIDSRDDNGIDNNKLWSLVQDNIFGIDIDNDAIEVAIFSLYVTVLDYVEPKIIEKDFQFRKLKDINFFPEADFFNTNHPFNEQLKDVKFDCILGNPPWGQTNNSSYIDYCKAREIKENSTKGVEKIKIEISDKQIAQAFIIRASDFCYKNTRCALVVTSKILYNSNAKSWRNYFLSNFALTEVFELSAVNTKIFNGANWPSAIIFYSYINRKNFQFDNIIRHISLKPNKFFNFFKTIVIEKYDYKKIQQKYFMENKGGDDWLWKVLLYGNVLDYQFIKRLKSSFKTVDRLIAENNLEYGVGLKRKDANKQKDASRFIGKPFLDTDKKELRPFLLKPKTVWSEKYAAAIPSKTDQNQYPILFKGPLALIKEGLDVGYKGVAAFSMNDMVFTHSVRAIKGDEKNVMLLKSLVSLFNSNLFAYYIFLTGTSTGIDFIRANQIEQISFPAVEDERLAEINDKIEAVLKNQDINIFNNEDNLLVLKNELENIIYELYSINNIERDLINYAMTVSIPQTRASDVNKVSQSISTDTQIIKDYTKCFITYFNKRLTPINKFLRANAFIDKDLVAINFTIESLENHECSVEILEDALAPLKALYNLSLTNISTQLYIQRDVKGFESNSFYIIKPNEYKCWHLAVARLDLAEFVDAILKSGSKQLMHERR